jgi:hypothetical protein
MFFSWGVGSQNAHPEQLQALSLNKGIRKGIRANVINVGILCGWTAGDCTRSKPRELDEIDPTAKRRL